MKQFLVTYAIALTLLLLIDGAWLLATSRLLYAPYLQHLLATHPQLIPVIIFYLLYTLGVVLFVVSPVQQASHLLPVSCLYAALYGALFGLIAYGTYDLTNAATLRDWPSIITIIDMTWGACMTGIVSALTIGIAQISR